MKALMEKQTYRQASHNTPMGHPVRKRNATSQKSEINSVIPVRVLLTISLNNKPAPLRVRLR